MLKDSDKDQFNRAQPRGSSQVGKSSKESSIMKLAIAVGKTFVYMSNDEGLEIYCYFSQRYSLSVIG